MKNYAIHRINSNQTFYIDLTPGSITLTNEKNITEASYKKTSDNTVELELHSLQTKNESLNVIIESLYGNFPEINTITINNVTSFERETFFQSPLTWNAPTDTNFPFEKWTTTKSVSHPVRPVVFPGDVLYERFVHSINSTVRFRVITHDDIDIFFDWHHQPRVADFWDLALTKNELLSYIQNSLEDLHQIPVIAEINNEAVGYFEIYWTMEDRLGNYYPAQAYDRGFHLLVGNTNFLGFNNTDALLKCATHFLFLDDPRTRSIMGEPRHDNEKLLKYVLSFKSWKRIKEFDFPHKRAVLLECNRELFFKGNYL